MKRKEQPEAIRPGNSPITLPCTNLLHKVATPGAKPLFLWLEVLSVLAVAALAILLLIWPGWLRKSKDITAGDDSAKKAIAILPVANLTGNPDLAWIPQTIQDDIIGPLNTVSGLIRKTKTVDDAVQGQRRVRSADSQKARC